MYDLLMRLAAVIDLGSVTAAANSLNVTQPAVTKSLQQLELHYGAKLILRTKRGMVQTETGQLVYRLAKLMQKSVADVNAEMAAHRAVYEQQLSVGAGLLWCYRYLPEVLKDLCAAVPNLAVTVAVKPPDELHDMICRGELDIGIGQMPKERSIGVKYEELLVCNSAFFCCRSHPLRQKASITIADLNAYPRISFTTDDEQENLSNLHLPTKMKINNLMLACLIMRDGKHIMRLPEPLAPVVGEFGIVPLHSKLMQIEFISGLFYFEAASLRRSTQQLIKRLRKLNLG